MATALPPSSTDNPIAETHYRKPRPDLYTLMLVISLLAVLIGIVFLCLYNGVYDWKMKDNIPTSMIVLCQGIAPSLSGFLG